MREGMSVVGLVLVARSGCSGSTSSEGRAETVRGG